MSRGPTKTVSLSHFSDHRVERPMLDKGIGLIATRRHLFRYEFVLFQPFQVLRQIIESMVFSCIDRRNTRDVVD